MYCSELNSDMQVNEEVPESIINIDEKNDLSYIPNHSNFTKFESLKCQRNNMDRKLKKSNSCVYYPAINNRNSFISNSSKISLNNTPRGFKLNKYFKSFHKKMSFEDVYGYPQPLKRDTKSDLCNNQIYFLREKMDNCSMELKGKNKSNLKGFDVNHLPRTDSTLLGKKYSNFFEAFTKSLNHSINVNHSNLLRGKDNELLIKNGDNLRKKLLMQINDKFLQKNRLPDIRKVADTNSQLVLNNIRNGFSKAFSDKYNPGAYDILKPNIKGRNYIGGVFQY